MCLTRPKRKKTDITNRAKEPKLKTVTTTNSIKSETNLEQQPLPTTVTTIKTTTKSTAPLSTSAPTKTVKVNFSEKRSNFSDSKIQQSAISIARLQPQSRDIMESTTNVPSKTNSACSTTNCANVVTIPVPIVHNEGTFYYVTVKGSLHDRSCSVFGLNDTEIQAISKRFESVKPIMNGVMIGVPPMDMVNTLSQLSYKVVCSSGEAEICWTMQREV